MGLIYGNLGGLGKDFLPGEPVFASARLPDATSSGMLYLDVSAQSFHSGQHSKKTQLGGRHTCRDRFSGKPGRWEGRHPKRGAGKGNKLIMT